MYNFQGAKIREQGVTFGVVVVRPEVLRDPERAASIADQYASTIFGAPVVLMAQDSRGRATYLGRPDLSRFLAALPLSAIPWRQYTVQ